MPDGELLESNLREGITFKKGCKGTHNITLSGMWCLACSLVVKLQGCGTIFNPPPVDLLAASLFPVTPSKGLLKERRKSVTPAQPASALPGRAQSLYICTVQCKTAPHRMNGNGRTLERSFYCAP
jgi:hypothetical protein